ncbi:MAG: hypothetical protein GC178_14450 [Flavobacteriales bacterium]|nr:hypothetical protein [Flavobacteriales bacterium]
MQKSSQKGNQIIGLHTGSMVEAERRKQRITFAVLSRRLGRNATGLTRILKRSSMQTYLVWELSVALGHNFFTDLAQQLDAATEGKLQQQQTELERLKLEYAKLKEERDYLRKAVDLLGSR